MIRTEKATKRFGTLLAVDHVDTEIHEGSVFGLIGSNGAGKSTFLRMLAGILAPDEGIVRIDEQEVYENEEIKKRCFYISDEQFFFPNSTPDDMKNYYKTFYPNFDEARYRMLMDGEEIKKRCFYISDEQFFFPNSTPDDMKNYYKTFYPNFDEARYRMLMDGFGLDGNRKIRTFSKGMKKQVSVICGLSACTDYLFCDETFDGLDPVARQTIKGLFAGDVADRGLTPVIASHNLRELEDICDHVGLLHRGGILFSRDLDDMKLGLHKVQLILRQPPEGDPFAGIEVLKREESGSLYTITARGTREQLEERMTVLQPAFYEMLPLTLEEIFISETEVAGFL